jgi:chemotaxis protein CheD
VSVCLWDGVQGIGGLTHFILPRDHGGNGDARFGDVAVPLLGRKLRALGCTDLVAKVFGGAGLMQIGDCATIGDSNTKLALELLQSERIAVVAQRTGGTHGMVIRFSTADGSVDLREIKGAALQPAL